MGCITKDYKDMLVDMIARDAGIELLGGMISFMPICEEKPSQIKSLVEESKRAMAARWPSAIYINEEGKEEPWDSPSSLFVKLTGLPVSGQICDLEGKSCRALSIIDNFQIRGFVVRGDGDEPPTPAKVDASRKEIETAHQAWKTKLLAENKKFRVYHPKAPQLKELKE